MEKAKQFILDNDSYYAEAVEKGYDIRMTESEILEWMQRYADNEVKNLALPQVSTSSTNSELGSYHWFHTILANHKDIGEFLSEKTPSEEILREWGKKLYETSKELIAGYESINRI